jgi:predicted transcriptional regulator
MSTTTIRLPADIKARIAQVATNANTNAHSFILQAITDKLTVAEQQADFQSVAQQRYAKIAASGQAIAWADMRHYLQERASGKPVAKPKARRLGV